MGYVSSNKPDIFVSYAHVNDDATARSGPGWVTSFVSVLKSLLAMKLGRNDAFDLWMDQRLAGNDATTPEISGRVRDTALFLIVLSHGYMASEWCRQEMKWFQQEVGRRRKAGAPTFVVEFDKTERPEPLVDLLGYRFWVDDRLCKAPRTLGFPRLREEGDERYYDLLNDLCHDLVAELKRLKGSTDEGRALPAGDDSRPAVYLAEATDDLDDLRDEVRRHLTQAGLRVLPEAEYPREEYAYRDAVGATLARSTLFVQLLSQVTGKKLAGSTKRVVALQHECALQRGLPVLQWHSRDLDPDGVTNADLRRLLTGPSVVTTDVTEFKELIVRRVGQIIAPKRPDPKVELDVDRLVFVNAEETDDQFARRIAEMLSKRGIASIVPARCGSPEKDREFLVTSLLGCDGLVLIHGTNPEWLVRQWDQFRKVKPRRTSALKAVGLCEGPPPTKHICELVLPGAHFIDCRTGLSEEQFDRFVSCL